MRTLELGDSSQFSGAPLTDLGSVMSQIVVMLNFKSCHPERSEGPMQPRDRHCYWVYILTNRSKTLYVGITNSLRRRVWEHKRGNGSDFCRHYKIDRLVYFESFDDVRNAIGREKRIKGWLRRRKIELIVSVNPEWRDLSEGWYERQLYSPDASVKGETICIGPSLRSG
jgi:putative endonuclease